MGIFGGRNTEKNDIQLQEFDYEKLAMVLSETNKELINQVAESFAQQLKNVFQESVDNQKLSPEEPQQDTEHNYTVKTVGKLEDEKVANEILATLFGNMPKPHPSRLRPFFTYIEQATGISLSGYHKERVANVPNKGDGKYPYRKIDSILMYVDKEFIFEEAKAYVFSK